ncbi:MAG: TolC family protein [Armatimonadota bacterium]
MRHPVCRHGGSAIVVAVACWAATAGAQDLAGDGTLVLRPEDCSRLAAVNGLSVRAAEHFLKSQRRGIDIARAGRYPTVSLSGTITRQAPTISLGPGISFPDESKELHAIVGQPLFDGGLTRLNETIARIDTQMASYDLRRARGIAALLAQEAAYEVLRAQEALGVTLYALTSLTEHLRVASDRFTEGHVAYFDVVSAETQVAAAKQQLTSAEARVERAEVDLKTLLDLDLDREIQVESGRTPRAPDMDVEDMAKIGLCMRADFDSARKAVERAAAESYYPLTADLPRFDLFADYRRGTAFFSLPKDQVTYGIQGSISVFDGRQGHHERRWYRERLEAAKLQAEQQADLVVQQIAKAYIATQEQQEIIDSARVAEIGAQWQLRISAMRYENDIATGQEVLDSQAALELAQAAVVDAEHEYNLAVMRLQLAMGVIASLPVGTADWGQGLKCYVYDCRGEGRAAMWAEEGKVRVRLATGGKLLRLRPLDKPERKLKGAATFSLSEDPVRLISPGVDGAQLLALLQSAKIER